MTLSEREEATLLANWILDNPTLDPDSDLSVLSRQFLRSEERLARHPDQRWGNTSFAQHFDDVMLLNLSELIGVKKPSYLDLGAHHPSVISNTKLLYDLGSRGVNVDANPRLLPEFQRQRPEDKNICVGVGPVAGEATFFMYSDSSGLNTFSTEEVAKLHHLEVKNQCLLPILTMDTIVSQFCGGSYPDLLCCDIEGLDFDTLSVANFHADAGGPQVICVETRKHETGRMAAMLERKGYFLYCRMGENLFFVRKTLRDLVY